jgi:hypothetical protein
VAGESKEDLVLVLAGGANLRGVVTGLPQGQLGGVSIFASGPQQYRGSTRTGADGRFELSGLPVGTTSVTANAGDMLGGSLRGASKSVTVAEGQLEADVEIAFEGTAALSGTITRGGRPVTGAMVFAGPQRGGANASTRADDSGRYRMEGLEDGDYRVSVQPTPGMGGGAGLSKTVPVSGETSLDFEIPTASLSGIVVAASTKQPLEGVRVNANLQGGASVEAGRRFAAATTDTNGRWFLDDVEPGTWDLTFRRTGYLEEKRNALASESGGDGGEVELTRGEGLELRVVDGLYRIPLRGVGVRVKDGAGASVTAIRASPSTATGRGRSPRFRRGATASSSTRAATRPSGSTASSSRGRRSPSRSRRAAPSRSGPERPRAGKASRPFATPSASPTRSAPSARRDGSSSRPPVTASIQNLAPGSYTLAVEGVAPKGFTVTEGGRTVVELP